MKIDIITIFPEIFKNIFDFGIPSQAIKNKLLEVNLIDLRNFTDDNYRQVDDRPYGGGPGMVLMPEPLGKALDSLINDDSYVINLSPKGERLTQKYSETLAPRNHLIIICGRYEGIDERIIDLYVDKEISIGDYIVSGGELPAMVLIDSVCRLIPGAIKNDEFNKSESFSDPKDRTKLDYPVYTRPSEYKGSVVPEVLLSGNHKQINAWRDTFKTLK